MNNSYITEYQNINENNDDDNDCLDTSWIQQENLLQNIQKNYSREPVNNIRGIFIYINQNYYINKIIREVIQLQVDPDNNYSYLTTNSLLKIIQTKKIRTPISKYKFSNIITNIIDIESEQIQSFSKIPDDKLTETSFFKHVSITDNIIIQPSIFIFHNINTIYFFFNETPTNKHNLTLKSALKQDNIIDNREPDKNITKRSTKKVRINDKNVQNNHKQKNKRRRTRKKRI